MADITMCINDECPMRDQCYRAQATPNEHRQSVAYFEPNALTNRCDWIIAINGSANHE